VREKLSSNQLDTDKPLNVINLDSENTDSYVVGSNGTIFRLLDDASAGSWEKMARQADGTDLEDVAFNSDQVVTVGTSETIIETPPKTPLSRPRSAPPKAPPGSLPSEPSSQVCEYDFEYAFALSKGFQTAWYTCAQALASNDPRTEAQSAVLEQLDVSGDEVCNRSGRPCAMRCL